MINFKPMKTAILICLLPAAVFAQREEMEDTIAFSHKLTLTQDEAERLSTLPLSCVEVEYPNKLNQVLGDSNDLRSPRDLHPAFYGCFDWHSAVHGHWSLVCLIRHYPDITGADSIRMLLKKNITADNIQREIEYFQNRHAKGFERMYGWAWLFKLADELNSWDDPDAEQLTVNLQPLIDSLSERMRAFLPKLQYPIRVGTHTNTAFALSMMYDYADHTEQDELKGLIEQRAKDFYFTDNECPVSWEPSGYDFLSPCLEEADLMRKVLEPKEFEEWIWGFMPGLLKNESPLEPTLVSDRSDGHLVHLDGLNFSRAWCLYGINEALRNRYPHLDTLATDHIRFSLPKIVDDHYEGGHWLASFALLALTQE